ncbi:TPA: hypothetical protein ACNDQI_003943, partial [Escherichia coli]
NNSGNHCIFVVVKLQSLPVILMALMHFNIPTVSILTQPSVFCRGSRMPLHTRSLPSTDELAHL